MLNKAPKPAYKKWLKRGAVAFFVIEGLGFIASYTAWHKINTERESRKYLRDNYPYLLESYYKVGEFLDPSCRIRQSDYCYWEHE